VPRSPVSLAELELLRATLLLGDDDRIVLHRSSELLAPRIEAILDVWYGFVGANPHLLAAFTGPDGQPDQDIWLPYDAASVAGSSILPGPSMTRPGSTTSTKSAYATPAGARTVPTACKPPTTYPCLTSSPYWFRLRRP
jgi:hypothetical protein